MTDELFMVVYRLTFSDGGEPEYGVLHQGDRESCERVANMIPAIVYSGSRPISGSALKIIPCEVTK